MDEICRITKEHGLYLVEDCAQSHGASFDGKMTGTFGDIGCFSFYPSKNLGAFGDGGAIVTNNPAIAESMRVYRNYGSEKRYYNKVVGTNSRLDELQAGLLRVRLSHLAALTEEKQAIAARYDKELSCSAITLPKRRPGANHVFHQYVIRSKQRDALISYLDEHEIGTIIHYPIPPHLSEAYAYLGLGRGSLPIAEQLADEVLSIPMYNGMTPECRHAGSGRIARRQSRSFMVLFRKGYEYCTTGMNIVKHEKKEAV
jgi:dTDP-4-amino-4,6-dideoxygalactose transaminase